MKRPVKSLSDIVWSRVSKEFWSRVNKEGDCWVWIGSKNRCGYGRFSLWDTFMLAHRVSWELVKGAIENELHVLHKCDTPLCVNPDHLFLGTQLENIADMHRKGRANVARGDAHASSKLNTEKVRAIRARYATGDVTMRGLAQEYGITHGAMWQAIHNETWKEIH